MRKSEFIRVALVDQMQQIADLGLWYHVFKLMPEAMTFVGLLVRQTEGISDFARIIYANQHSYIQNCARLMGPQYEGHTYSATMGGGGSTALSHSDNAKEKHMQKSDGVLFIHVPTFFEDFKKAAISVAERLESGELEDGDALTITPKA